MGPEWLIPAYRQGIFPWFNPGEPILWWTPEIRYGFLPGSVHLGRSRRRQMRSMDWSIRADTAFGDVIRACAEVPRAGQLGTWIGDDMIAAYSQLNDLVIGHSIEVFDGKTLIGGLYGLALGRVFFAESMFSHCTQASAAALFALSETLHEWRWSWLDAQMENPHLRLLGGQRMDRTDYLGMLARDAAENGVAVGWTADFPGLKINDYLAKTRLA